MIKDRAKKTSEAGKSLSSFARGKLEKKKTGESVERKREAGNNRPKWEVSGRNWRVGISADKDDHHS